MEDTVGSRQKGRLIGMCLHIAFDHKRAEHYPRGTEEFIAECIYHYGGSETEALIDFLYNYME